MSRSPSPRRLKPRTTISRASPGKRLICGASNKKLRPELRSEPHVGVEGGTPIPRKLKLDSVIIVTAIPKEA